jgi:hypothetical protein
MGIIIIISLFLLVASLIAGLFIFREAKRMARLRKRLQEAVNRLSEENGLLLRNLEYFRDKVIGIDKINKKLVFAHFKKGIVDQLCVDLKSIASCMLSTRIDERLKQVTHVFLQLHLNRQREVLIIEFYDNSRDNRRTQTRLLEKARYWKDQINFNRKLEKLNGQFEYVL